MTGDDASLTHYGNELDRWLAEVGVPEEPACSTNRLLKLLAFRVLLPASPAKLVLLCVAGVNDLRPLCSSMMAPVRPGSGSPLVPCITAWSAALGSRVNNLRSPRFPPCSLRILWGHQARCTTCLWYTE